MISKSLELKWKREKRKTSCQLEWVSLGRRGRAEECRFLKLTMFDIIKSRIGYSENYLWTGKGVGKRIRKHLWFSSHNWILYQFQKENHTFRFVLIFFFYWIWQLNINTSSWISYFLLPLLYVCLFNKSKKTGSGIRCLEIFFQLGTKNRNY